MEDQAAQQEKAADDSAKSDGLLYHYTDQKGLLGILNSDCIWATHYGFLNDLSEHQEAVRAFLEVTARTVGSIDVAGNISEISGADQRQLQKGVLFESQAIDAYFVSFTQEKVDSQIPSQDQMLGDRLSQWRGYALDRQGFSLGFQKSLLEKSIPRLIATAKVSARFLSCIYDAKQKDVGMMFLSAWDNEEIRKWSQNSGDQDVNQLSQLKQLFHAFLSEYKHIGFKEEQELRLVLQMLVKNPDLEMVKFRDGRFGRTPYVEVPLGLRGPVSPLRRIVVGPAPDKEQVVARLRINLVQLGIHGVEVVASKIPYRNW
jgi:hypothetical protein